MQDVTSSVRDKSSTRATKPTNMDLNKFFLTPSGVTIVSTDSSDQPLPTSDQAPVSDTAMVFLKKIDATNQAMLKRVDDMENQCVKPSTLHATSTTSDHGASTMPILTNTVQPIGQHHSSLVCPGLSHVSVSQQRFFYFSVPSIMSKITGNLKTIACTEEIWHKYVIWLLLGKL